MAALFNIYHLIPSSGMLDRGVIGCQIERYGKHNAASPDH